MNRDKHIEKALNEWLKRYTWIQEDGSLDYFRPRQRKEGQEVDDREKYGYDYTSHIEYVDKPEIKLSAFYADLNYIQERKGVLIYNMLYNNEALFQVFLLENNAKAYSIYALDKYAEEYTEICSSKDYDLVKNLGLDLLEESGVLSKIDHDNFIKAKEKYDEFIREREKLKYHFMVFNEYLLSSIKFNP